MRGTKNNTMQTKEEKGGRGETERRGEVGNKEMVCINFNILYKNAVGAYLNSTQDYLHAPPKYSTPITIATDSLQHPIPPRRHQRVSVEIDSVP